MDEQLNHSTLNLSQNELNNIDKYRKEKNTAVLTIMFTDIQGFTALTENKGETYVHELHQSHDKILVESIEENNAGIVIKYIGDSIMAVFSEPTAAADKALKIQKRLHEFNESHPELDNIKVRIGLHMGQTVIENKMQTDLFGRHVNKASRVESLASGGHVYISYPVFDSIKSWLMDMKTAGSKFHGSYYLKGIAKAEEIYEIYNADITKPEAPKKAKKKQNLIPLIPVTIAVLFLGLGGIFLLLNALKGNPDSSGSAGQKGTSAQMSDQSPAAAPADAPGAAPAAEAAPAPAPAGEAPAPSKKAKGSSSAATAAPAPAAAPVQASEVYFLGMIAREPILDFDTPLAVTVENEAQGLKKSINDISPGKHIIHYIVSYMVRYYAEFTVKPGKNVIPIAFKESYLPNIDVNYSLAEEPEVTPNEKRSEEESYFFYDRKTLSRINFKGKEFAEVSGVRKGDNTITFTVHYSLSLNDKVITDKKITFDSPPGQTDWTEGPKQVIYEDADHYYTVRYKYINNSMQFSLECSFKD